MISSRSGGAGHDVRRDTSTAGLADVRRDRASSAVRAPRPSEGRCPRSILNRRSKDCQQRLKARRRTNESQGAQMYRSARGTRRGGDVECGRSEADLLPSSVHHACSLAPDLLLSLAILISQLCWTDDRQEILQTTLSMPSTSGDRLIYPVAGS